MGILFAMALVHGAGGFQLFSPTVFKYLACSDPSSLVATIEEVPDQQIREILLKVSVSLFE